MINGNATYRSIYLLQAVADVDFLNCRVALVIVRKSNNGQNFAFGKAGHLETAVNFNGGISTFTDKKSTQFLLKAKDADFS